MLYVSLDSVLSELSIEMAMKYMTWVHLKVDNSTLQDVHWPISNALIELSQQPASMKGPCDPCMNTESYPRTLTPSICTLTVALSHCQIWTRNMATFEPLPCNSSPKGSRTSLPGGIVLFGYCLWCDLFYRGSGNMLNELLWWAK